MEAVGNMSSELDERRRPRNEDFCCQVEEQTKRTMETVPSEVGKGEDNDKNLGNIWNERNVQQI